MTVFAAAPEENKEKRSGAMLRARFDYIFEPSANLNFYEIRGEADPVPNKKPRPKARFFIWCGLKDLNLHSLATIRT